MRTKAEILADIDAIPVFWPVAREVAKFLLIVPVALAVCAAETACYLMFMLTRDKEWGYALDDWFGTTESWEARR